MARERDARDPGGRDRPRARLRRCSRRPTSSCLPRPTGAAPCRSSTRWPGAARRCSPSPSGSCSSASGWRRWRSSGSAACWSGSCWSRGRGRRSGSPGRSTAAPSGSHSRRAPRSPRTPRSTGSACVRRSPGSTARSWPFAASVFTATAVVVGAAPGCLAPAPPPRHNGGRARDARLGGLARDAFAGVLSLTAYLLVLFAYAIAPLATVAPLRESGIVLAAAWGAIRLGEAIGRRDAGDPHRGRGPGGGRGDPAGDRALRKRRQAVGLLVAAPVSPAGPQCLAVPVSTAGCRPQIRRSPKLAARRAPPRRGSGRSRRRSGHRPPRRTSSRR